MAARAEPGPEPRVRLSRERVLRAAIGIADEHGIQSVTMRRLGEELGAEAMSLYYHVAKKDDLLDGIVDLVAREINDAVEKMDIVPPAADWKTSVRQRILTAREVLLRHRWAPGLFETRTTVSLEVLRYYDALLGLMLAGGFSYDLAHHAMHTLGSRALGFTQELFDPGDTGADSETGADLAAMAEQLPNIVGMLSEITHDDPDSTLGWCDDQTEFEFGLDLILDGLDRMRAGHQQK
ncbi:TetR/AcrR family transcriptional regulator C-terminal domain-containing protein [Nocardia amamiensis]|uniref:TetR/AcrR family transcriptional regulator C-terminal domain-containing protein n=1 Tax=Nocardia amamiensis TaxID=404578 RepID=UPI002B4B758D|nr:TetR/AcrR family transcriptional regulator C-terminal domain-containing protein [Nocardia amamiensis]